MWRGDGGIVANGGGVEIAARVVPFTQDSKLVKQSRGYYTVRR